MLKSYYNGDNKVKHYAGLGLDSEWKKMGFPKGLYEFGNKTER
jgi:hypothetical protein